jgi:hypothetical protein
MGVTYVVVNAGNSSTSANPSAFERGGENFRPVNGERPEFETEGRRGGSWMFGLVKSFGIVAVIVAMIVMPKSFMRKKAIPVRVK